ncbi:MAG TPA: POTRA domain-containing protein, partial [Thermoanaerobaculia bacterium]|nr:POTRA domain-containing protein [Thermoanaerobaculia bacterium]
LEEFYRARGFFGAQVLIRVRADPASGGTALTYLIQSGPRATISTVVFQGETAPFTPAQLVEQLEQRPGRPYDQSTLREDVDRLQTWLVQQEHRAADVRPPTESIDAAANTVALTYPIEVGPRVTAVVEGADLEDLRRRNLLPFLGEQGFDEALVTQAAGRVRRYYQEQGHYRVQVESRIEEEGDELRVVLTVAPGPVYTLEEVRFTGNETFGAESFTDLIATAPRGALARFGLGSRGRLVTEELDADLENILAFYRWEGFPAAEIGPARVEEQGSELRVEIPIREGLRQVVETLELRGVQAVDPRSLSLPLEPGGPFSPSRLDQALARLRQAYVDRGYAGAQVSARQEWDEGRSRVGVIIEALEGPRILLDRVIVRGNQRTDSDVIRRSIALRPGDPVSQARVYEIERDLYRLGIFSSVDAELTLAGIEASTRDLIVRVREGLPRRVAYGLGFEYSREDDDYGPRGSVSFTHNNVAGRALTLRGDLRVSSRLGDGGDGIDVSSRLLLGQPYLGRYPVPTTYSLFYFDENRDFGNVTRKGARVESHRDFGDRRVGLVYDYRLVELTDAEDPFRAEPEDQDLQISSLVPSFFWDRRDDPLLATRGWSSLAQLQYAFPFLQAEGEFLKLFVQQTQYLPLNGRPPAGLEQVVVASLRAGGIEPFDTLRPELSFPLQLRRQGLPSADVFIDERFFAGGATTHRAYGLDDLGIRGETLILRPGEDRDPGNPRNYYSSGGNGLLLFNLEYRFPLFGPVFGGSVFYDAGNVWPDWRDIDTGDIKQGIGVGLRYNSPIGPIRIDVGYKLDPDPGEEDSENRYQFNFTFGNPF